MALEPFVLTPDGVQLMLRVTPNARDTQIDGAQTRDDGTIVLGIRVREVPDKGRANKAAIALLAKNLPVPKSTIAVTRGATSRLKTLTITGNPDELAAKITALISKTA